MGKLWRKLFPVQTKYVPYEYSANISHVTQFQDSLIFTTHYGNIYQMKMDYGGMPIFQKLTELKDY